MSYAQPTNMTTLTDMFVYANTVSNNIFGIGFLVSLWIVIFGVLKVKLPDYEFSDCGLVASFTTCLVGVLLLMMGVIQNKIFFGAVAILVIFALWRYWSN